MADEKTFTSSLPADMTLVFETAKISAVQPFLIITEDKIFRKQSRNCYISNGGKWFNFKDPLKKIYQKTHTSLHLISISGLNN